MDQSNPPQVDPPARQISMRCVTKALKDSQWHLRFDDHAVTADVIKPDGASAATFSPQDASRAFVFPSFGQSVKFLGIPIDGRLMQFDVSKGDLAEIRTFVDLAVLSEGSAGIARLRRTAWINLVIGIIAVPAGIAISVGSYYSVATSPNGGTYYVTWGISLFGLIQIGRGIYKLRHAALLARQLREVEQL